jgi:hypothetical protein
MAESMGVPGRRVSGLTTGARAGKRWSTMGRPGGRQLAESLPGR